MDRGTEKKETLPAFCTNIGIKELFDLEKAVYFKLSK